MKVIDPKKPLGIELTPLQVIALRASARFSAEPWGAGVISGRLVSRRTLLRLAQLGMVVSNGFHPVAGDDGCFVVPDRYAEAWLITTKGRNWLMERDDHG